MPRLNLDDDFQLKIQAIVEAGGGTPDRVAGNSVRFLLLCQDRYKHGLVITENEFRLHGFLPQLVGVFAKRLEAGGFQALDAERLFGWLRKQVVSGQKGGLSKSPAKLKNLKQNSQLEKPVFNDLAPKATEAESKATEASSSPSSSPSFSNNNKGARKTAAPTGKENSFNNNNKNWLVEIWNEERGKLPPVVELSRKLAARLAEFEENPAEKEKWREAFKRIAASKACNGKGRGSPFYANFNFAARLETRANALNGTYSENNAPLGSNAAPISTFPTPPELTKEERDRAAAARAAIAAALPFSRGKKLPVIENSEGEKNGN